MKSPSFASTTFIATLAALALLCSPCAAKAQNPAPPFIIVGQTYQAAGGPTLWRFTVLEIGPNGWIKVRTDDGEAWMNVNMLISIKNVR